MKPVSMILGAVMILIGLIVLYMASQMIIHAFRGISGLIQGALIVALGGALVYYGYKRIKREKQGGGGGRCGAAANRLISTKPAPEPPRSPLYKRKKLIE